MSLPNVLIENGQVCPPPEKGCRGWAPGWLLVPTPTPQPPAELLPNTEQSLESQAMAGWGAIVTGYGCPLRPQAPVFIYIAAQTF